MDYDPVDQYFDDLQDENDLMAYALEYFNEKRQKGKFTGLNKVILYNYLTE